MKGIKNIFLLNNKDVNNEKINNKNVIIIATNWPLDSGRPMGVNILVLLFARVKLNTF